jgi:hypothetical protein
MDPMTIAALAPIVMGAMKGQEDKKLAKENAYITSMRERMAPLTGARPNQNPYQASALGPMMQGAAAGADMYQKMQRNQQIDKLIEAYDKKESPQFTPTFNLYDQGIDKQPELNQDIGPQGRRFDNSNVAYLKAGEKDAQGRPAFGPMGPNHYEQLAQDNPATPSIVSSPGAAGVPAGFGSDPDANPFARQPDRYELIGKEDGVDGTVLKYRDKQNPDANPVEYKVAH